MSASDDDLAIIMGVQGYAIAWATLDHLVEAKGLSLPEEDAIIEKAHRKLTTLMAAQPNRLFELAATFLALDLRSRRQQRPPGKSS